VFYPEDWEPVSREQLTLYQQYLVKIDHFGAALIGISVNSISSHTAFGRALGLTFPLLSGFHPKGVASRSYGIYVEDEGRSARAVVVLDGAERACWSRVYPTNLNAGIDGILTVIERMQAQDIAA